MFGEEEGRFGPPWVWFLLGLQPRSRTWFLFDPAGARALLDELVPAPVLMEVGAFPTLKIWRALTGPYPTKGVPIAPD